MPVPQVPAPVREGGNMYTPTSYGNTVSSGGTRRSAAGASVGNAGMAKPAPLGSKNNPASPTSPMAGSQGLGGDPMLNNTIDYYGSKLSAGVKGYADIAGQDFQKQIGVLLGNLNSIGALRSGGVQAGIDQAMTTYGRQVGDYASMTANSAAQMGTEENNAVIERKFRQQQADAAKKNSLFSGIGSIIGGVAGTFFGPAGTAVGSKLGGAVGGALSGGGSGGSYG